MKNHQIAGVRSLEIIDVFIEKQSYSDQLKSKLKVVLELGIWFVI